MITWLYNTCLTAVILTTVFAVYNTGMHLLYFSRPELQSHIIRIILLIPVTSLSAWLSFVDPARELLYESFFEFWEALVVYSFFMLILSYAGGEHVWFTSTQVTHPEGLEHPFPFKKCFPPMNLDVMFMRNCKRACLQFVLIKPFMAILAIILTLSGHYEDVGWVAFRNIVYNVTYSVALYALALLLVLMHSHPGLVGKKPVAKFLSVKAVIFLTFYQSYLIPLIPNAEELHLSSLTICFEMFLFSVPLNFVAFNWSEFRTPSLPKGIVARVSRVIGNGAKALSPADLAVSAALNFAHRYETHVLLEENDAIEMAEQGQSDKPAQIGKSSEIPKIRALPKALMRPPRPGVKTLPSKPAGQNAALRSPKVALDTISRSAASVAASITPAIAKVTASAVQVTTSAFHSAAKVLTNSVEASPKAAVDTSIQDQSAHKETVDDVQQQTEAQAKVEEETHAGNQS